MPTRPIALIAVLLLALGSAALADEHPYEPTFERQEAWFHAHTSPVGNVDGSNGDFVVWDEEEPTGPVPAAYHGNNLAGIVDGRMPDHFFTAQGTFIGDLENLAFDMYLHGWAQAASACDLSLSFELRVDGKILLLQDYTGSAGFEYEQASTGVTRTRFALTNIWQALERNKIEVGPDVEHDIYVNIQNFYLCNELTWLYDAASTPAGLIANVEDPAAEGYFEVDVRNPPPPIG